MNTMQEELVEVDDTIPNGLSVLDYEFGAKHAGALASLLMAAVCSDARQLLHRALTEALAAADNDLDCLADEAKTGMDDELAEHVVSARRLRCEVGAFRTMIGNLL